MNFEITSGKILAAQKVVIYGPEGVGKSSFAALFPSPVFIDTEGSTNNLNVMRLPRPSSWEMLKQEIDYVMSAKPCKTIIIDTIDWAEQLCIESILATYQKKGLEEFGYGNGYVYEKEEFGRFLNKLEDVIQCGINVVLTAHAQLRKFTQPDEFGEYDRWELKLGKKTGSQISPLVKEWADLLLFANYKTFAVAADKDGKKFKAQGNARVMYTEHHPCWDAKNRHGLPAEMPFEYSGIAHIFNELDKPSQATAALPTEKAPTDDVPFHTTQPAMEAKQPDVTATVTAEKNETAASTLPKALSDLMAAENVTEAEIRKVVSLRGYFPEITPISNYPDDFIEGVLIGAWSQVFAMIKQQRELNQLP